MLLFVFVLLLLVLSTNCVISLLESLGAADEEQRDNPASCLEEYLNQTAQQREQNFGQEKCRELERDKSQDDDTDCNDNTCSNLGYVFGVDFEVFHFHDCPFLFGL